MQIENLKLRNRGRPRREAVAGVVCPECGAMDARRYGRDQATGRRKYQCRHCWRQFVRGKGKLSHRGHRGNEGGV